MTWLLYRWVWKLAAPLHVGMSSSGNLNRCRVYVPARALWGALTAECARSEAGSGGRANYAGWGERIGKNLRLGYLFPAEQVRGRWQAWLPCWREGQGLVWQREDLPEERAVPDRSFRMRLLHARPGTAIEPDTFAASEGTLRETECWNTRWRTETGTAAGPAGIKGYVFVRKDCDLLERLEAIRTLFLGGDTRYGLGRVIRDGGVARAMRVFGHETNIETEEPIIIAPVVLAHAMANGEKLQGSQERLVGWNLGQLERLSRLPLWTPGSGCPKEAIEWQLCPNGLWRSAAES